MYQTDLQYIAAESVEKEYENDHFLRFMQRQDDLLTDKLVHEINDRVSAAVDCTACGNCCKTLVINVTSNEVVVLSANLDIPEAEIREKYIETSQQGHHFINAIPCTFLSGNMCSIYPHRFTECRDFPHLHKPGFKQRLLGTLLHYGRCPIIYNVVEELKNLSYFKNETH